MHKVPYWMIGVPRIGNSVTIGAMRGAVRLLTLNDEWRFDSDSNKFLYVVGFILREIFHKIN